MVSHEDFCLIWAGIAPALLMVACWLFVRRRGTLVHVGVTPLRRLASACVDQRAAVHRTVVVWYNDFGLSFKPYSESSSAQDSGSMVQRFWPVI